MKGFVWPKVGIQKVGFTRGEGEVKENILGSQGKFRLVLGGRRVG